LELRINELNLALIQKADYYSVALKNIFKCYEKQLQVTIY